MTSTHSALGQGRGARISAGFVLLVSALTAIGPLTIDLYLAAFPQITTELATSPARVQLTITATLAGLALGQLLIGSVSDAYGRRPPLIAALSVYVLSSLAIVLTPSVEMLATLRFVQGFSASAGMVVSMAIVRDRYEGVAMGKVMARLMLVVGLAPILAPTIGAQMLLLGSWRLMFVFLAGFGVLLASASASISTFLTLSALAASATLACFTAFTSGFTRFFGRELMRVAALVRGAPTFACDLTLTLGVHAGKAALATALPALV